MKFAAVSTFNGEGLELYGRRMMETFASHWPASVPLTVYSEGWTEECPANRVELITASPWLADFKKRHAGRVFRDYRWDAVRFSHKVAAVCHAALSTDADVLIWIDGDVVTHSPISEAELEGLAPTGREWIAWLDRDKVYPECGFYMMNCRHLMHREVIAWLQAYYAEDLLFRLPEWHDSYVLEHIVKNSEVGRKSLSGEGRKTSHPLVNGPLSKFFDHAKGNRKKSGRTPKGERKIRDGVAYWQ
jgi:hypothetical protein